MRLRRIMAAFGFLLILSHAYVSFASEGEPRPIETTMAYDMLQLEKTIREVSPEKVDLFRRAMDAATSAARAVHVRPRTPAEALAVFEAMQIALVRLNFVQPAEEKDWPESLGEALTPRDLSSEQRKDILETGDNRRRQRYVDASKPLYFVDCDMGSLLLIGVGQRMGWDIRLAWADRHNFVRWHLDSGDRVNWDWTHWMSYPNEMYVIGHVYEDWPQRRRYITSLPPEYARTYYMSRLTARPDGDAVAKLRVLEQAMLLDPTNEAVQNSLAWLLVTTPELAKRHHRTALAYALSAWASAPTRGTIADTAACAFMAAGEQAIAVEVEKFAIDHATNDASKESYERRRGEMEAGKLCTDDPG